MYRENAKITLQNKTSKQNAVTIENQIYQIHGEDIDAYNNTLYEVIYELTDKNIKEIVSDIKQNKYGWNHKSLETYRNREYEQDCFIVQPFEIIEGIVDCKCGSKRVYSYSKQTRSGDESITTFNECLICKNKWIYSG